MKILAANHRCDVSRMPRRARRPHLTLAAIAVLAVVGLPSPGAHASGSPDEPRAAAKPAGPAGAALVVDDQATFSGFDLATDPGSGVAYLGWISNASPALRQVHLCVLPPGATGCQGGVLTANALDPASAAGLSVVVANPGVATLVWFHQSGLTTGKLATATYSGAGLSAPTDVADAPSNGSLQDVVLDGAGQVWAVTQNAPDTGQNIQVRQGLNGVPVNLAAPWYVGKASLAFATGRPVLLIDKYGAISEPVWYASGPAWTAFAPVPKTWSVGGADDLVSTASGVRMVAAEGNAGYRPVVASWTGNGFRKPELTGDKNSCPPTSHDLVTDASGRIADVGNECGQLTLVNLADTLHAGLARFSAGGTISSGPPQITSTARGYGWVAWGIQDPVSANRLLVAPVRLPALLIQKTRRSNPGRVMVQGPATCLPVVSAKAKMTAKPAGGWRLVSKRLKLDGKDVGTKVTVDGERLAAGSRHRLVATASFRKNSGGATKSVRHTLKFRVC